MSHACPVLPLESDSDEQTVAFFRRVLPDFYFVNTPLSRMRRHLELLRALPTKALQIEFHRPPGAQFSEMMLCGHDASAPGLLAGIAGALAALKINVHTAWIHTLDDPNRAETGADVVLDTLILSENYLRHTRPLTLKTQAIVASALRETLGETLGVAAPVAPPRKTAALEIRELSLRAQGQYTVIQIEAPNETGVLFRVAQSVAAMELNIAHAQINTFEDTAADIFFVTDATRQPLAPTRFGDVEAQLRALLTG